MQTIDHGLSALQSLKPTIKGLALADANEAETRKKIIDDLLESVLGWTPDDVSYEERVSEDGGTTYADYILRTASAALLVEAKRVGKAFELPSKVRNLKLGGVLSQGTVGEAIRQARDYCRKKSIPFACVTNGDAWIIFAAVRTDGVTFEETNARVFRDLDSVENYFVEFWELLSYQRVCDGNLSNELVAPDREASPHRLITTLKEPGFRLGRNALYEHIEPAIHLTFSDSGLLQDIEALERCYVKTAERAKFDARLNQYLGDIKPLLGTAVTRVRTRKSSQKFDEAILRTVTGTPRFFLVLGPVGAGKTTFLHYTRWISAREAIDRRVVWLHVDFKAATERDNPREFIYRSLRELMQTDSEFGLSDYEKTIGPAYHPRIDAMRKGPGALLSEEVFRERVGNFVLDEFEKVVPYVDTVLKHSFSETPGFIVVDNVDQLECDDLQREIFLETQAIAAKVGASVVLSLRDSTYVQHRDSPSFDAFQFETLYIDPPGVMPVLSKRFAYARKELENRSVELTTERGIRARIPNLADFVDLVTRSLLSGDTGYMLEVLSGHNIRRGLDLVKSFLSSGHISADKAIVTYLKEDDEYTFPAHEVFKGAILGQRANYREEDSLLLNLFDAKLGVQTLQLLRMHAIRWLVHAASSEGFDGISANDIAAAYARVGVPERDITRVLTDVVEYGLLRTADGRPLAGSSVCFPNRLAGYTLRQLCGQLQYVEYCALDAAIHNRDSWEELLEFTQQIEAERDTAKWS